MNIPADLKYTKNDTWLRVEGVSATSGITEFAVEELSDIVDVDLAAVGLPLRQGESYGTVESVKAASELYMGASGTITAVNDSLRGAPDTVNKDPYGAGWMVKFTLADAAELDGLMDAAAYQNYCEERKP